jgi:hypothetical protein
MRAARDCAAHDAPQLDALATALARVLISAWQAREGHRAGASEVAPELPDSMPSPVTLQSPGRGETL